MYLVLAYCGLLGRHDIGTEYRSPLKLPNDSFHVAPAQDGELKQELQATQAHLNGLDVEDLDAEHESLALSEHVLQKLQESCPAGEEPPLPAAPEEAPPKQQGQGQPSGEGTGGVGVQPAEEAQQPIALLGPP